MSLAFFGGIASSRGLSGTAARTTAAQMKKFLHASNSPCDQTQIPQFVGFALHVLPLVTGIAVARCATRRRRSGKVNRRRNSIALHNVRDCAIWTSMKAAIVRGYSSSSAQNGPSTMPEKPRVLFVLGGPGSGKGTQCDLILGAFQNWAHISAGDCLRAERMDQSSNHCEVITAAMREGKIVPAEITVRLLLQAMTKLQRTCGKTNFLIDGFPRDLDNLLAWTRVVKDQDGAELLGAVHFNVSEDELKKRLLSRSSTSGRVDDNIDSIQKRLQHHIAESVFVLDALRQGDCRVIEIDANPSPTKVWESTEKTVRLLDNEFAEDTRF